MSIYVPDACALIAYLNGENGSERLHDLFLNRAPILLHRINLYEVLYDAVKRSGPASAVTVLSQIQKLPLRFLDDLSTDLLKLAAEFKSRFRSSLADSIALACAYQWAASLVTCDLHEFDALESQTSQSFYWIR